MSLNEDKNVPEQKATTVDTADCEEASEYVNRGPSKKSAAEESTLDC